MTPTMHKKKDALLAANFEVVREYINTGRSEAMHEEHQRMLDTCITAYGLLKKFPFRNVCIRKLMALKQMPYTTAAEYVDFTRQTWGDYLGIKREFLEIYFLQRLISEIEKPGADEGAKAKNFATLQKFIEHQPAERIDPHLMEANTINIQVNLGTKSFTLNEKVLATLPQPVRQQILAAIDDSVDDAGAEALLNT